MTRRWLRPVLACDLDALADLHERAFPPGWSREALAALLGSPGVAAFLAESEADTAPCGFVLVRTAADEGEVLTIAVDPDRRRAGIARALLDMALAGAVCAGARAMFLEVEAGNVAAERLYASAGFRIVGLRRDYYRHANGDRRDAQVMRLDLPGAVEQV